MLDTKSKEIANDLKKRGGCDWKRRVSCSWWWFGRSLVARLTKRGKIDYRYRASSETIDYLSKSQADRLAWLQSHPVYFTILSVCLLILLSYHFRLFVSGMVCFLHISAFIFCLIMSQLDAYNLQHCETLHSLHKRQSRYDIRPSPIHSPTSCTI